MAGSVEAIPVNILGQWSKNSEDDAKNDRKRTMFRNWVGCYDGSKEKGDVNVHVDEKHC